MGLSLLIASALLLASFLGCHVSKNASNLPTATLPEELQKVRLGSFDRPPEPQQSVRKNGPARFGKSRLPSKYKIEGNQLLIHSDAPTLPKEVILQETAQLRSEVFRVAQLPEGKETIHVYLFENMDKYRHYVSNLGNKIPKRRALFIQDKDSLKVLAYSNDQLEVDLRHEITHGYLHSVVPNVPLWIDEGLAEYFEHGAEKTAFHPEHLNRLQAAMKKGNWSPDLGKLEELEDPMTMSPLHYSESWLWTHFILNNSKDHYKIWLHYYLRQYQDADSKYSLAAELTNRWPDINDRAQEHLKGLLKKYKQ